MSGSSKLLLRVRLFPVIIALLAVADLAGLSLLVFRLDSSVSQPFSTTVPGFLLSGLELSPAAADVVSDTRLLPPMGMLHSDAPPEEMRIDLNRAGSEDLQVIPGIGVVIASRIVRWRAEHGPFRSADQLIEVSGIGTRKLEKMRGWVTINQEDRGGES